MSHEDRDIVDVHQKVVVIGQHTPCGAGSTYFGYRLEKLLLKPLPSLVSCEDFAMLETGSGDDAKSLRCWYVRGRMPRVSLCSPFVHRGDLLFWENV